MFRRAALALPLLAACPTEPTEPGTPSDPCEGVETTSGTDVRLRSVASGLDRPSGIAHAGDGSGRLFVTEQEGRIKVLARGASSFETWLDIDSRVTQLGGYDERGLLGLAFHPDFEKNGRFYVDYIDNDDVSTISEFRVEGDPLTGDPDLDSERVLLTQQQPASNHNGGQIQFGPDGFLYIAFGDGGGGDDTYDNGQRKNTFHAKILRIDVDGTNSDNGEYGIPSDNPFVSDDDHRGETWAWGLRNPWRFSFDRATGAMWIGDVGQDRVEEIDIGRPGANYGWPIFEANRCNRSASDCEDSYEEPVYWYSHNTPQETSAAGISVTGGYVYRGCELPDVRGLYLFTDWAFSSSPLWSIRADATERPYAEGPVWIGNAGGAITSFGEDESGELYAVENTTNQLLKLSPD